MEQAKLTNQKETLVFLQQKYPKCFFGDNKVKPLKIGIFQDLAADLEELELVSKRLLRMSLRHYTSSWRYLASVKSGVARIDLSGVEGELVEQQHADHAAEQLKESKAKAAALRESKDKQSPAKHKGYKGKTKESTDAPKGPRSRANIPGKGSTKPKQHTPKAKVVVKQTENLADTDLVVGKNVLVKLGKEPMPVTITDINKDGISVQLKSGMTVKVKQAQLYKVE